MYKHSHPLSAPAVAVGEVRQDSEFTGIVNESFLYVSLQRGRAQEVPLQDDWLVIKEVQVALCTL